jgi:hypothetical protein
MKRFVFAALLAAELASVSAANAQVDWRFGFEDTWNQLNILTPAQRDAMLGKLTSVVAAQKVRGAINLNTPAGGWREMQANANTPINFAASDQIVQTLQRRGFALVWEFILNADWARAGNTDCYNRSAATSCAPDAVHENDLYNYVFALVERYDGDGVMDMGYETPTNTADDLKVPIQFYVFVGELEFSGATPPPQGGYGDASRNHFWSDTIDNLLKTHRIIYRAVHDADPSGRSKFVGAGGIFWDLYNDFPDWPAIEGPTLQARLNGNNNHQAIYQQSFNRLKQLLTSFGNDADGVECDYVGWHPHMPWRDIDQAFKFIKTYAGNKPIFVDDMWCNIFLEDRADAPGYTQFTAGGQKIEGDFPNASISTYTALRNGVIFNNPAITKWYYARHARTIVKAFASAFGEGAERVSLSGINDFTLVRLSGVGHINIMGTLNENFFAKPGYYTCKLLVEKLHDFITAQEIIVSNDPRTRVYKFDRPAGPIYVLWSETGAAPPNLDYRIPTGETVTFKVLNNTNTLKLTHIITDTANTKPQEEMLAVQNGRVSIQLGYEPIFLEGGIFVEAPQIAIQPDTLFFKTRESQAALSIVNAGFGVLKIDSIKSHQRYGWSFNVVTKDTTFSWEFYGNSTNHGGWEKFKLALLPGDSARLVFHSPDLCPICKTGSEWSPFTDTLYVFSNDTLRNPIKIFAYGEGRPSAVDEKNGNTPREFFLAQNYPNPFAPRSASAAPAGKSSLTEIRFQIPSAAQVTLKIYNIFGQAVRELANRRFEIGSHQLSWDGRDDTGKLLASGVYFLQLRATKGSAAADFVQVRKMLLIE